MIPGFGRSEVVIIYPEPYNSLIHDNPNENPWSQGVPGLSSDMIRERLASFTASGTGSTANEARCFQRRRLLR